MGYTASIYFDSEALYKQYEATLPRSKSVSRAINEFMKAEIKAKAKASNLQESSPIGVSYNDNNNDVRGLQETLDYWLPKFDKLDNLDDIIKLEGRYLTGHKKLKSQYVKVKTSDAEIIRKRRQLRPFRDRSTKRKSNIPTTTIPDDSEDVTEEEEIVIE